MRLAPNYDQLEQLAWRENSNQVLSKLQDNDKGLSDKIKTAVWRFGYRKQDVIAKIKTDKMFANTFTTDPKRQTFHENIALEWLKQEKSIKQLIKLRSSGKDAFYITSDGDIVKGKPSNPGKSLDFRWKTGNTTVYATHKYTKSKRGGGSQDNQAKDVSELLKRFQSSKQKNVALVAIVDGQYYTPDRLAELKRYIRQSQPYSFVGDIASVPKFLNDLILNRT